MGVLGEHGAGAFPARPKHLGPLPFRELGRNPTQRRGHHGLLLPRLRAEARQQPSAHGRAALGPQGSKQRNDAPHQQRFYAPDGLQHPGMTLEPGPEALSKDQLHEARSRASAR